MRADALQFFSDSVIVGSPKPIGAFAVQVAATSLYVNQQNFIQAG